MDELLAPHIKLPVAELKGRTEIEPNMVYLCPPGFTPRAEGVTVHLDPRSKDAGFVLPIDLYLDSLARTLGDRAVAVILSGTGSDGSRGIKLIRQSGGRVFVEDPATAGFTGMPQSAISTGVVHAVAPAGEIWAKISDQSAVNELEEDLESAVHASKFDSMAIEKAPRMYQALFEYLKECFELDFSSYRINSVERRILRRMQLLSISDISGYLDYLRQSEDETNSLYHDLLIGVTRFFRDEGYYKVLFDEGLVSALKANKEREFRIWVAGCATGEEAYSLYVLATEAKRAAGYTGRISMFATDVFKPSIETASAGIYSAEQLRPVSEARRQTYFKELSPALYRIRPEVRENIIFAPHNFLLNAPFTKIDLVTCRNVLIYLDPEAQEAALRSFSYALKDGGLLFLGSSESLGKLASSYKTVASKQKIYKKQSSALDQKRWSKSISSPSQLKASGFRSNQSAAAVSINRDLLSAYDSLIERYAPTGFLINKDREILHYFGRGSNYFVRSAGRANSDSLDQLDPDIKLAINALIYQAMHKLISVTSKGIRCHSVKDSCVVDVTVGPLKDAKGNAQVFLVEIDERKTGEQSSEPHSNVLRATGKVDDDTLDQIKILEEELRSTKENLEVANEELQVSNEELQAINEEMQVSNEELQSTNEELHSLNEELSTLNAEYERKNDELIEANGNLQNLLESTEDGVLFVDNDLFIRNFNPAIATAFKLLPSDVGRPLEHIAYVLKDGGQLANQVREVLEKGSRVEEDTEDREGSHYMKRIVPFRRADRGVEGAIITFTDVTQFYKLNSRFNFAIETVGMSWWDWDLRTGKIAVNSTGGCILGDDCSDAPTDKEGWMNWVHPDDCDEVARSLEVYLDGQGDSWECEHRFKTGDDKWLWVRNCGRIINRDTNGAPTEMMGTTQDIDVEKKTLLRSNYQRDILETAGEIAALGVWEYDPEKKELYWSDRIRAILGVDDDFDPNLGEGFEFFTPEDRELLKAAFNELLETGVGYDLDLKCINHDGKLLLTRSAGRAKYDSKGKIVRVVGLFQDITDVTRTEHEMAAYFSMTPDYQATVNLDMEFHSFNASWLKGSGYTAVELKQKSLYSLMHPSDMEAFKEVVERVKKGNFANSYEARMLTKDDSGEVDFENPTWMSWSLSSDSQLGLIFVSARSISEQKAAQAELELARMQADEANRAKSDFLAVMSHELRTPLNPILGFSEMLLADTEDPEEAEVLQTIIDSGNHMTSLISEILDFSKIDAGMTKLQPEDFSLKEFVRGKVKLMRGQIKDKPVELTWELDAGPLADQGLPYFHGDVSILRQICRNLLGNAIKFTEEGRVTFRATVLSVETGVAQVEFEVEDTGIGIPQAAHVDLFEPFTQADSSSTRQYGGTGLGLAICKRLVNLLKGEISFESESGLGTTFRFRVPLPIAQRGAAEAKAGQNSGAVVAEPLFDYSPRILLVEDNPANAFYVERILAQLGAQTTTAKSGELALEFLEQEAFELILLDLHMPGIGGLETLQVIREDEARDRMEARIVVVLTADVHNRTYEACIKMGANEVVTKPVSISALRETLLKHIKVSAG